MRETTEYQRFFIKQAMAFWLVLLCILITPFLAKSQSQSFTAPGNYTFTVPANVTAIRVECWGAGGSGVGVGSVDRVGGGGGGGGAYARSVLSVTAGNSFSLFVGAGGAGVNNASGNPGQSSWFGSLSTVLAAGGDTGSIDLHGRGGSVMSSIGNIKFAGGDGGDGKRGPTGPPDGYGGGGGSSAGTNSAGNSPLAATGWIGGIAPTGGGAGANGAITNAMGGSALTVGGGGGGAKKSTGNGSFAGGNGFAGQVIVSWPVISDFNGATSGCAGTSIIINGVNLSGATSVVIGGTPATVVSSTSTQIIATIGNGPSGTVTVTTDAGTVTSTASFTVYPKPAATTVTGSGTFCDNTLISASNGGDGTMYYQGTVSNGTSTADASTSKTVTASGTYYFRALSSNSCWGDEGSAVVTINASSTVNAGPALSAICQGATTPALGGSFGGGATGAIWSDGGAGGTFTNNSGSTPGTTTYTPAANSPSPVTLTLTTTGGFCNTAQASKNLTINPVITGNISGNALVCQNATPPNIVFTASNGTGPYTFSYNINGGTTQTITTASGNSVSLPVSLATTGTFVYTLSGILDANSDPCSQLQTTVATVIIKKPVTINGQPSSINTCSTLPVSFSVTATGDSLHYQWYKNGVPLSDNSNISGSQAAVLNLNQAQVADAGNYYVIVGGSSACGSVQSNTVSLKVSQQIVIVNQPSDVAVCTGGTASFTVNASGTGIVYQWRKGTVNLVNGGNISGVNTPTLTITNASAADAAANYNVKLTSLGSCPQSISNNVTLIVNPIPIVNILDTQVVCNGAPYAGSGFSGSAAGTVYNWTNDNPSIGLSSTGTGNLPAFTAINTSNAPVYAQINVTPEYTNGGVTCTGAPTSFTIVVNPSATVDSLSDQIICNSGSTSAVHFSSNAIGGTIVFKWVNSNPTIGLAAAGSGDIASFTGINNGTAPVTATITVTPSYTNVLTTCDGVPYDFNITVNPSPVVNAVADQVICGGTFTTPVNFGSTATGGTLTYNWTNSDPSIGLPASGSGPIPSFTAINNTSSIVTATIKVTATFTNSNGGSSCTGPEQSFLIRVYPTVTVAATQASQTICSETSTNINLTGTAAGTSFSWTVLSQNGATGATAGTGTSIQQALTATGSADGTVIYAITASANGCSASVNDTVTVKPQVDLTPLTQSICSGASITPIAITGSIPGSITGWTRNNPSGISSTIPLSGSGPISGSFTNSNSTATAVTFMVTVQANNGCQITRSVTVNVFAPLGPITASASQIVCTGNSASPLSSTAPKGGSNLGYTYQWQSTDDPTTDPWVSIPGATKATYTPPTTPKYYQLIVTNSCGSVTSNLVQIETGNSVIEINPPGTDIPASICDGQSFWYHLESGNITSSIGSDYIKYTWQSQNPGDFTSDTTNPFGTIQTGTILGAPTKRYIADINFTAHNTSNALKSATFLITPIIYRNNNTVRCALETKVKTLVINPVPVVSDMNVSSCSGTAFIASPANGVPASNVVPADTKYSWSAPVVTGGITGGSSQNAQTTVSEVLNNPTDAVQTATYTVTTSTDSSCAGNTFKVTVSVNPSPKIPAQSLTICSGASFSFAPVNNTPTTIVPAGTTYSWNAPTGTGFTGGLGGSGSSITGILSTINATPVTAIYTVTPTAGTAVGGCTGTPFTFTVTINPKATASFNASQTTVCYNGSTSINFSGSPNTVVSYTVNGNPATITLNNLGAAVLNTGPLTGNTTYALTSVGYTSPGASCIQPLSGSITIIVNPVATAAINHTPLSSICAGQTSTLNFTGTPNTIVTYNDGSADQTITLDAGGNATLPVNPGATTTYKLVNVFFPGTASCTQSLSGSTTVTVQPDADAGTISGNSSPLCIGATLPLTSNGNTGGIWKSSNTAIATVNASGVVTALAADSVDILYIVTAGCNAPDTAIRTITINPDANAGIISGISPLCINSGGVQFSSSGDAGGTWTSSNPSVVAINAVNGVVTTGTNTGTGIVVSYKVTSGCNASAANPVVATTTVDVVNASSVAAGPVNGPVNICSNSSGLVYSVSSLPNATQYAWALPAGWSITAGDFTNSITVQVGTTSGSVSVNAGNACGYGPQSSLPVVVTPKGEWRGITSNWNDPVNWCNNTIPDATTDVVIPSTGSVVPYYLPVLSADGTSRNLTILSSATLDLNGHNFALNGAYAGPGTITGSQFSGLTVAGNAGSLLFTPNILPTQPFNNYLKTFTINSGGSAALGNALNIAAGTFLSSGVLTANGTLATNGLLTLKSEISGDARVGTSTAPITGEVTVERYIPARRAWRFLTVPFAVTSQSINQAWQEGQTNTSLDCPITGEVTPHGIGTQIAYINGYPGYDYHNTGNPSLQYWNGTGWSAPSSTLSPNKLTDHDAWYAFIRGDRYICLDGINGDNTTTLRAKGILNQLGGVNRRLRLAPAGVTSGNYFMVGNPYASPINVQNLISVSRAVGFQPDKIWVMDPKVSGSFGVGGFVTYTTGVGWVPYDNNRINASYANGDAPVIQSGQGFMVYTNSSAAQVEFLESDKDVLEANVFGLVAKKKQQKYPVIFANLLQQNSNVVIDGVAAAFGAGLSSAVDEKDVQKLWNVGENIALVRNNQALAVELRSLPVSSDTLFYKLYLRQQPYVFSIFAANFPEGQLPVNAWLVDRYLGTKTMVNLADTTFYSFVPNTDTNSYRNRFMLVFQASKNTSVEKNNPKVEQKGNVAIYPNPVTGKKAILQFNNVAKGNYEITLYSANGHKLKTYKIQHEGNIFSNYTISLGGTLSSGNYSLVIYNQNSKNSFNLQVIISR